MQKIHTKLTQKYPKYNNWHQTKHHNTIHWGVLVVFALIVFTLLSASYSISLAADTVPPIAPTNLTATAISSSQINLSWTASTDNVGVTGYKIYRCAGSACAPTVQISTSAVNSYSNTGLTASTAYTYAVSAYDAAGNNSAKSSSVSATTLATSLLVAFPGAEGFGANSVGGRGGRVIKVTNLNDSGPGSFREAVTATGARIVIFAVSGIINLQSHIDIYSPYLTIAGQTSPGGILITGNQVTIVTHDVIVQHVRFRVGSHQIANGADPETLDSFDILGKFWGGNDVYNVIIDHSSFSWGVDETFTISGGVTNTTVQWSIVSEGLSNAGHPKGEHSKGLLISGKYVYPNSVSVHHNYIAHNYDRNPELSSGSDVDTVVDFVNNVSYDWFGQASLQGNGGVKINWVNNYARQGVNSNSDAFEIVHYPFDETPGPYLYVYGNIGSTRLKQSDPQWNVRWGWPNQGLLPTTWRKDTPWPAPPVTTTEMSYDYALEILKDVGATKPVRDSVDARVIADFAAGTGTIIDNVVYPDDFPTFANIPTPTDTDNDGMADTWEISQGLNPAIDDSALDKDNDGYTNIEEYLHYLSGLVTQDTQAPSDPTNLTAQAVSSSQINLSWTASRDDVGVTGYKIYRDGILRGTIGEGGGTSYFDTGLTASTTYTYAVSAYDAAGNESGKSMSVSATTQAVISQLPAFPGAEGFGANSVGGRGGRVIKVTNLNDSGPGSFREAVTASGARIVIFAVSGIINLQSDIYIYSPYLTIAGETSPGGILVTGRQITLLAHDIIVRHMRFRVGSHRIADGADPETLDSFDIWGKYWGGPTADAHDIIIDHSSFSWGVDETFAITGGVTNTTVQWSIVSEGLANAGHPKGEHSKGMLISGKYVYPNSVSSHHNYIAHNRDRSPEIGSEASVDTLVDFVNNVSYDWYGGLALQGVGAAKINWVNNYVRQGSLSNSYAFEVQQMPYSETPGPYLYVYGNIGSTRLSQSDPQWNVGLEWSNQILSTVWQKLTSWPAPPVTTAVMSEEVANCILTAVGATAPIRDSVDTRVVNDFAARTGTFIDNVRYPADFPTFTNPAPPIDNDNDGMADSWETSQGLNTSVDDSALDKDSDGYTNIEEYLHFLSNGSYVYNSLCMPDINAVPDSESPTTPTNLTANATLPSQINLSWNASSDNIRVLGYRIYRCAGSACAPTAQIATSATNSYSDTGLTASTAYTYAVSAYDAAGNESGKSSSVSATTLSQFKQTDFNQDGLVNQLDFDIFKQDWNRTDKPVSDINQDGVVDSRDLGIMMSEWTR